MTDIFLKRCKIDQLQRLLYRYQLKPKYMSSHRKRHIMEKTLEKYIKTNGIGDCPICFEPNKYNIVVTTQCAHIFCDMCITKHLQKNHTCPLCRESIEYTDIVNQISPDRMITLSRFIYKKHSEQHVYTEYIPPIIERVNNVYDIVTISNNICINIMNVIIVCVICFNFLLLIHVRMIFRSHEYR
jgi:hypothetical protein